MPPSDQDFRREKRVAYKVPAPLAPVSGSGDLIKNASTIDLSESGLRVRLNGQIAPGQVVEVFLTKRPEQCRVVWTTPTGTHEGLIAGLEFIVRLPDPRRRQTPPSSRFEPIN